MSKPLFSLENWKLPTQIAPEVTKKISKTEEKKAKALKLDILEVTNKLFQNGSTVSDNKGDSIKTPSDSNHNNQAPKRKSESKKNKPKKKQKKKNVEPTSILNLDTETKEDEKESAVEDKTLNADKMSEDNKVPALSPALQKMQKTLQGSKFRLINEMLYTITGVKAYEKFQNEPEMFEIYHTGFRSQVESWPSNPVDSFINYLESSEKKDLVVADMGCGEAELALKAPKTMKIHSFDLYKANERITPCDIAHTPLTDNACDVVIFSLSLMGTNYADYISEASRILKPGGQLKIAEVVSRFEDIDFFIKYMSALGFHLTHRDDSNKMFVLLDFVKNKKTKSQKKAIKFNGLPEAPTLKPCIYKRR